MQRSLFCRFSFALAAALAATFAAHAETYYYVGGEASSSFAAAANWETEDGARAAADITSTDTVVFTNASAVSFSSNVSWDGKIVKRGEGDLNFNKDLAMQGTLALESGKVYHANNKLTLGNAFSLEVKGPTNNKQLYLYGNGTSSTHVNVTIPHYSENDEAASTMTFYLFGNSGKTITFKGAENSCTRFSATMDYQSNMQNLITFKWDPGYASSVLEIVKREYNRPHGAFLVSSGTLRFGEDSRVTSLSNITVAAGATLEIGSGAKSDAFECPVWIEEGGKLKVSRRKFTPTGGISYNGTAVSDGRYQAGDFPWIEGDGVLYVGTVTIPDEPATVSATWDGGGADTLLTTAENWVGDIVPNLTDGSLVATFPTGTEATVPDGETVAFKGIAVSAPSFALKGGVGSKVALGSAGVTATGAAFTNACPTVIARSQTWSVEAHCEFAAGAEVSAAYPENDKLTLSGKGKFVLLASNPKLCDVDYHTIVEARADVPLGGRLVTAESKVTDKVVECYGNVFSNNFTTSVNNSGTGYHHLFRICSGENVFCGKVESANVNGHYWRFADNNTSGIIDSSISATFKGGYSQSLTYNNNGTHFSPYYNGIVNIEQTPLSVVRMFVGYARFYRQILNLNVSSNNTTRGIHILRNSTLNTTAPYALYATDEGSSGVLLNDGAKWNLSADQGVNVFGGITNTAVVASQNGATFHLRDDRLNTVKESESQTYVADGYVSQISLTTSKVQTNRVCFAGNVNFSKEGILDHWMEGVSTSTGSVSVKKGRLIFTTGSWQNASSVSVSDGGTLELRNGKAFGRDTPVAFTGENTDGMLVIPAGTNVRLRNVLLNGRRLNGVYSSGLVTGGGSLTAGMLGMSIIFR